MGIEQTSSEMRQAKRSILSTINQIVEGLKCGDITVDDLADDLLPQISTGIGAFASIAMSEISRRKGEDSNQHCARCLESLQKCIDAIIDVIDKENENEAESKPEEAQDHSDNE